MGSSCRTDFRGAPLFSVCVLTPALSSPSRKDKSPPASLGSYYCPPPHPCPEERGQICLWSPSASIPRAISPVCIFIMQTIHTHENKYSESLCVAGQGEKSGNFFTDSFVPLKRIYGSVEWHAQLPGCPFHGSAFRILSRHRLGVKM